MCVNIIPSVIPMVLPNITLLRTTMAILLRVSSHALVHRTCNLQCGSNPRLRYWSFSSSHKPKQTLRPTGISCAVKNTVMLGRGKDKSRHGCDTFSEGVRVTHQCCVAVSWWKNENSMIPFFHWLSVLSFDTLMESFLQGRVEPCETSKHFLSIMGSSLKFLLNSAFSNFEIHLQTFAFAPNTILAVDVCLCGMDCLLFGYPFLLAGIN